jgi:hypothetical protein
MLAVVAAFIVLFKLSADAFKLDLSAYESYKSQVNASAEIELDNMMETYMDAAGFEDLMDDYSHEITDIYKRNIEKAIKLQ